MVNSWHWITATTREGPLVATVTFSHEQFNEIASLPVELVVLQSSNSVQHEPLVEGIIELPHGSWLVDISRVIEATIWRHLDIGWCRWRWWWRVSRMVTAA